MLRLMGILAAGLALLAAGPTAQAERASAGAPLEAFLDRFAAYGYDFSILVAQDGSVLVHKTYGQGLDDHSVFNVASVSKQFTATAVLKLAQEGRLRLDDPITRWLPDAPSRLDRVTVDHLLAHTSGIRDDYGLYEGEPDLGRDEFRQRIFARPLASEPRKEWEYSNDGYALLAMIVEEVSGQTFTDYVRQELFQAAGLRETGFVGDDRPAGQLPIPRGGQYTPVPPTTKWVGCMGSSCVASNPGDLYRWELAMQGDGILSSPWRERLTEPQAPVFGGVLHYARGWWLRQAPIPGGPVLNVFHSGVEQTGFSAWYSRFPDRRTTLIFASPMAWEDVPLRESLFSATRLSPLETILFGGDVVLPPAPADPGPLEPHAGVYRLPDGARFEVSVRGSHLDVTPHGQSAFDRLTPALLTQAAPDAAAAATARTTAMLAALMRGDPAPFVEAIGDRDDGSERHPPKFDAFEVLGSYPVRKLTDKRQVLTTRALLTVNGRPEHWHFIWNGQQLGSLWPDREPALPLFRGIGPNRFANLHPLELETTELRFEGGDLVIGDVRAIRTVKGG